MSSAGKFSNVTVRIVAGAFVAALLALSSHSHAGADVAWCLKGQMINGTCPAGDPPPPM